MESAVYVLFNAYGYNARSELISFARTGGSPSLATEHEYAYDPIGNRTSSSDLGTTRAYTANSLNQYTEISTLRAPASPREIFTPQFDDDRNQTLIRTKTGIWSVTYNGENRPIAWSSGSTNIVMKFDRMGRRVSYTETVGVTTNAHRTFTYDNYLQIADNIGNRYLWDPTEPIATRPLAFITSTFNAQPATHFYTHDGNKNVSELVDDSGVVTAHYEYAPFGGVELFSSGSLATTNPFRFSSEYVDDTLGLVYYNYRHYEPVTGRWMSRDPILVPHKLHLGSSIPNHIRAAMDIAKRNNDYYVFCKNRINAIDLFGFSNAITHKGRCCNKSSVDEWALVSYDNNGKEINEWHLLRSGECVGSVLGFGDGKDCEGMTCGGGFYYTNGIELSLCFTPRCDSPLASLRRWTPTKKGRNAKKPSDKCKTCSDYPPDYPYTD